MQHLFQSTFLQALGYAIANSLWQTALVWLIYISVSSIISMSAARKYRLAVAAQVTGFVWFIVTFQFYYSQYNHALQQSQGIAPQTQPLFATGTDLGSQLINWMVKGEQLLPYVSMAYLLLMLFLSVRWFLGFRNTQRVRHNGLQKMPVEWRLFVQRIAGQLNIKQTIRIYLSSTVSSPLTIGFLKPVILIPVASINHLTTDQLEAVLLHELAHIRRFDYLVNIILSVVEISLFFNPFTQLLSKHIRKERENSCDDWVLQFQYDASTYAEALLRIAYLQSTPAFAMAAAGKKNELLVRVKRMIGEKDNRFSYRKQLLAFAIVTGILCSVAWLNPIAAHKEQSAAVANKLPRAKYQVAPMAVTVDNPLFNPVFFLSEPLKEKMKKDLADAQIEIADNAQEIAFKEDFLPAMEPLINGALDQAAAALSGKDEVEMAMQKAELGKLMFEKFLKTDSMQLLPRIRENVKNELAAISLKKIEKEIIRAKEEAEKSLGSVQKIPLAKETIRLSLSQAIQALDALNKNGEGLGKLVGSALKSLEVREDMDENARELFKQLNLPADDSKARSKVAPVEKEPPLPRKADISIREKEDNSDAQAEEATIPMNELPEMLQPEKLDLLKLDLATLNQLKQILVRRAAFLSAKKISAVPAIVREIDTAEGPRIVVKFQ